MGGSNLGKSRLINFKYMEEIHNRFDIKQPIFFKYKSIIIPANALLEHFILI